MFKIQDGRKYFYQWDIDRKLIVEDGSINQVHFCNRTDECSLVCEVYDEDGIRLVNVPNVLLQDIWRINVYGYDVNYTKHNEWFDVYPRTKPSDYVYTETETLNYNTLLDRINEIDESIEETVDRWLEENPPEVDLSAYATVDYVDEAVSNVDILEVDLSGYYTKEEVDNTIAGIDIPEVDLTGYATEEYVNTAIENIDITESGTGCNIGKAGTGENAEIFNNYTDNVASGDNSHAEGNSTKASGIASHAEGVITTASGAWSHSEGYGTESSGQGSHAEGNFTIAKGISSHVQGKFNIEDKDGRYAHIVGNGDSITTRSNAHTLDWNGNAWFKGKVYVGGSSMDDATELGTGGSVDLSNYYTKTEIENLSYQTAEQVNTLISDALAEIGVAEQGAY